MAMDNETSWMSQMRDGRLIRNGILEQLKTALIKGELSPGDRLPTMKEIASSLNVSETPVRETLKALEAIGVVKIERGKGIFIKEDMGTHTISPLIFNLILRHQKSPYHLLELRRLFEAGFIELAVQKRESKDLRKMKHALEDYKTSYEKQAPLETLVSKDLAFHYAILEATKNPLIMEIGMTVYELLWKTIRLSLYKSGIEKAIHTHLMLYEAVRDKNREKAINTVLTYCLEEEKELNSEK